MIVIRLKYSGQRPRVIGVLTAHIGVAPRSILFVNTNSAIVTNKDSNTDRYECIEKNLILYMSCIKQTPKSSSAKYENMVGVNNKKLE